MPHDAYRALYIHIPFCAHRCDYCDFMTAAVPLDSPTIDPYIDDMVLKIRRASNEGELSGIESVYIGGGTPSYIGLSRLSMLLYTISTSMNLTPEIECSMEANPDSLTDQMVRDIWALGVNRLSIGVQSFDDEVLRILGRIHDADRARHAIRTAHERFENVSVDLMCGVPGQSDESFKASVQEAIELGVSHVSVYPLTIEPHTVFANAVRAGEMDDVDEDVEAHHLKLAEDVLGAAGFERYEVSSYAKPGFQCRHNISYWTGVPYIGFGSSAVTMTQDSEHRMRVQDDRVVEDLNKTQMVAEDLMMAMRMTRGVSDEQVQHATDFLPEVQATFNDLVDDGLVFHESGRWKPTELGWLCGNELYGRIFDLAP